MVALLPDAVVAGLTVATPVFELDQLTFLFAAWAGLTVAYRVVEPPVLAAVNVAVLFSAILAGGIVTVTAQ
jgi:hypothetical protein